MSERDVIDRVARELVAAHPEKAEQARKRWVMQGWFDAMLIKAFDGKISRERARHATDAALLRAAGKVDP